MGNVNLRKWQVWVDTGGTFTDGIGLSPGGELRRVKVLSNGTLRGVVTCAVGNHGFRYSAAWSAPDGFGVGARLRGLREQGEGARVTRFTNEIVETDAPVILECGDAFELIFDEEAPVLAARLLTRTSFDKALPAMSLNLATTRGTNALLERKGARTVFFVTKGFRDLLVIGDQRRPDLFALNIVKPRPFHDVVIEIDERLDAEGNILRPLHLEDVRQEAKELLESGVESAAIAFIHGFRFPAHERRVRDLLRECGFAYVSASSDLAPFIKILPRAQTSVVDAYLSPVMHRYLDRVESALDCKSSRMRVMTSAGGLISRSGYHPKDGLLSGPAGGVVGAAMVAQAAGFPRILAFDMGGTSTDVSRFDSSYDYQFEQIVGDARLMSIALRIETVAAGGGSICGYNELGLFVGPSSAGASPGPACYGAGGPLTLTDVNLLLGRLDDRQFGIPVDTAGAEARLAEIAASIERAEGRVVAGGELLAGFLEIANERMADTVRRISVRFGYDPRDYALLAFGGAGGLHACAIAEKLEMGTILFPADAGLLSALGLRQAALERIAERQILECLDDFEGHAAALVDELVGEAREVLRSEEVPSERMVVRRRMFQLRFQGQESTHDIEYDECRSLAVAFEERYRQIFGYFPVGKMIEAVSARVVVAETSPPVDSETFFDGGSKGSICEAGGAIRRDGLVAGQAIDGPVVIQDPFSTIYIAPGWIAAVGDRGTLRLSRVGAVASDRVRSPADPLIDLELFSHRFTSIVDEMGSMLERTAVSTNVKERLDFSCALMDADGELITNAPHIPVHLGALGVCVRTVLRHVDIQDGDMIVTNHPAFGGSHLPDVTVISGVFDDGGNRVGFVANRAHHAEMGGIRPGSMPTSAASLAEEGVVIEPNYLYRKHEERFGAVADILTKGPYPTRALEDNLADLGAQAASNRRGVTLLRSLVERHNPERVRGFMRLIKQRSSEAISSCISRLSFAGKSAVERLDDGTELRVNVERDDAKLILDFAGTSGVHPGNFNATPAITQSAVIYFLRLLVQEDVPLNEGLMRDVEIRIPAGILNPAFPSDPARSPAVVGGNVETSQRLVDLLIKVFGLCAGSQGTMNNLIFGNASISYYETICGGHGAGRGFAGCDAVHTHMTNTGITDPEIFETRFAARINRFEIRKGSGGDGEYQGGDGVVRDITFLDTFTLSLLTQHRVEKPFGMSGGGPGLCGRQRLMRANGVEETLGSQVETEVQSGDRVILETPGGGGYGSRVISDAGIAQGEAR